MATVRDTSTENKINIVTTTENNVNVTQPVTSIVTISALGPQGAQGPQGQPGEIPSTGSFVLTSSFNSFTSSYYVDSSSFSTRIINLENFSSSLDATFATDAELNAATASLSASISYLSSSFETFSGSYNTGSFTGSFTGDGSQLTGIVSSKWTGSNPITREGNVEITGSLIISGSSTFINIGPAIFSGSVTSVSGFTGSLLGTASYSTTSSYSLTSLSSSYSPSIPPFPFVGDASITGSLTISGSFNAFRLNTTDVILGEGAGALSSINGPRNVLVGYQAGYTNTTGDDNVAIGYKAGYGLHNNASDGNIFIGKLSGAGSTSGIGSMSSADYNIGIGVEALLFLTQGDYNISIGYRSMRGISSGLNNIGMGQSSLGLTTTGNNNIGIGTLAGLNQTSGDGNITIGSGSLGIAGESNQLRIGNGESVTVISASLATGDIIFASTASAAYFVGDGSQLTNVTASFSPTSSYALTASYVEVSQTASYVETAQTASYVLQCSKCIICY
jgi:hypothetical protein